MHSVSIELVAMILLILVNGFLSMSEMAVVSARRIRLRASAEAGDRKARAALRLIEQPDRFFSTVQTGITLVGILTGAFGGATVAEKLEISVAAFAPLAPYSEAIALALVVLPTTCLTIVLGELVPKRLAFSHPETLAAFSAPIMTLLMRLASPAVRFLSFSTGVVIRGLRLKPVKEVVVTEEEIRATIGEAARSGVLEEREKEMLERIMRLGDRRVGAMMTHRSQVVWLDMEAPWEETLRTLEQSPFSKFPVIRGDVSQLIGVLPAKQFLAASRERRPADLEAQLLPPLYVPETLRVLQMLDLFKRQPGMHLAVIVDEYGEVQGIVTLNDILEAIVGDVASIGKQSEPGATRREDGSWIMDGLMPMDEVVDILHIRLDADEHESTQTLAGFLLAQLGEIPVPGRYVAKYGYRFEVIDMDDKRIDAILVSQLPEDSM